MLSRTDRSIARLLAQGGYKNAYVKGGGYGASWDVVAEKDTTGEQEVVGTYGDPDDADKVASAINRNAKRVQPFRNWIAATA